MGSWAELALAQGPHLPAPRIPADGESLPALSECSLSPLPANNEASITASPRARHQPAAAKYLGSAASARIARLPISSQGNIPLLQALAGHRLGTSFSRERPASASLQLLLWPHSWLLREIIIVCMLSVSFLKGRTHFGLDPSCSRSPC